MRLEEIKKIIADETGVLLYFWGEHCNVCHALEPKLFEAFERNFPKIKRVSVDVKQNSETAAGFGVFSIPTAIVFLDGREFARVGRNVSVPALVEQLKRPYELLTS